MTKRTKKLIVSLTILVLALLAVEAAGVLAAGICNRLLFHKAFFAGVGETVWGVGIAIVSQLFVGWLLPRLRLGGARIPSPSGVEAPPQ